MPIIQPTAALSTRQKAFCRHFTASGNAADAARRAGYSKRSARQTVRFDPPPAPANDLPPADDPPEDTCDPEQFPGEWADGDRRSEEERAEGAETDWRYQRRNNYAELHDPWSPENIERRHRDGLNRLERAGPFNPPGNADCAPDHDKT